MTLIQIGFHLVVIEAMVIIADYYGYAKRVYMNKIYRLHERYLRIIYDNKRSSFEDLLEKNNSPLIHRKYLDALVTTRFKVYTKTSPENMQEIFPIKDTLMQI